MKTTRLWCLALLSLSLASCDKTELNKVPVVEAGNAQTIQLPTDSVSLNGSASDADGRIVAYLWSEISGPVKGSIVFPGSSTAVVKGLNQSGTYVFQLMATDNQGATGTDTVSVVVRSAPIQTKTFQPHNNQNETMLAVRVGVSDVTDPNSPEITAMAWTYNGGLALVRSPFKFDLTSVPTGSTVLSAKLTLYSNPTPLNGNLTTANSGTNNAFLIQRATSSWDRTINWSTQPSTETEGQVIVPHTAQSFADLVDLDVTAMVQKMVTSGNYGFMAKLQSESYYNSRIFCSSKHADQNKHPKLIVTYR